MSGRWSMMAMSWGKLYWPRRSAVICIPDGMQVVLAEVENDCQDVVMSGCAAPQVKGFLAGVKDVVQKLVSVLFQLKSHKQGHPRIPLSDLR